MKVVCVWGVVLLLLAGSATGCGGNGGAETNAAVTQSESKNAAAKEPLTGPANVKISVEGWESPSDFGIVGAKTGGFFEDAGRNVWIGVPARPKRPVSLVST